MANIGVLVGIIFVSKEINLSNRIAERDGRSELVTQDIDLQNSFIENPDLALLMLKLSKVDPELSALEQYQVDSIAQQFILRMANLNISYESGFLSGKPLQRHINGLKSNLERSPGIFPFLITRMRSSGLDQEMDNPIFQIVWKTIGGGSN